jgi:hypothetical protein
MRIARPVGLSQDGRSLIVATPSGEELAVAVDERLHAVLRGDQPRLGQLEIEMENALGPRDIQSRIRSGQSLEEVGRVAGIPLDRVERFAAPVLAEREHVALLAMSSSVRRRGETSGHRLLRLAVTERLVQRNVDIDSVDWDAWRREDGRWTVTAAYASGDANRRATFVFDLAARFSVADDDEARWVLGEQTPVRGPQPGRRRPAPGETDSDTDTDTEPTLDLNDELALVRVIQDQPLPPQDAPSGPPPGALRGLYPVPDQVENDEETDQPDDAEDRRDSPLDTLASMMDDAEDEVPSSYGRLSDASAVPDTDNSGWEPAIVVNYPVEPSPEDGADGDIPAEGPADGSVAYRSVAGDARSLPSDRARLNAEEPDPRAPATLHGTDLPGPPERIVDGEDRAEEAEELAAEAGSGIPEAVAQPDATDDPEADADADATELAPDAKAARAPAKRKRAAVPSWDEIMFGGPPRSR